IVSSALEDTTLLPPLIKRPSPGGGHKYKKLLKRTKFLRRRWMAGGKRSRSKRFEKDLQRIWMIFNKQSKVSERLKSTD
uniref:Ribosomal protein mS38 C-terminal domain-containing protein n=1 Tax=Oncorhynchus tshawytscha TaxID=74940 RepID=A0A8C8CM62_ONCTS